MEKINLVELIDVSVLQAIQDGFSAFTGMAALTTDADGVSVLSIVPADDTPIFASDVNLKAKLSVGAPLMPLASIQPSNLSLADASQKVLAHVKLPNS